MTLIEHIRTLLKHLHNTLAFQSAPACTVCRRLAQYPDRIDARADCIKLTRMAGHPFC